LAFFCFFFVVLEIFTFRTDLQIEQRQANERKWKMKKNIWQNETKKKKRRDDIDKRNESEERKKLIGW